MGKPVIVVPILVVASLVVMSMAVSGAALTGNDLLPACRDFINKQFSKDPLSQGQCIGMIDMRWCSLPRILKSAEHVFQTMLLSPKQLPWLFVG